MQIYMLMDFFATFSIFCFEIQTSAMTIVFYATRPTLTAWILSHIYKRNQPLWQRSPPCPRVPEAVTHSHIVVSALLLQGFMYAFRCGEDSIDGIEHVGILDVRPLGAYDALYAVGTLLARKAHFR